MTLSTVAAGASMVMLLLACSATVRLLLSRLRTLVPPPGRAAPDRVGQDSRKPSSAVTSTTARTTPAASASR